MNDRKKTKLQSPEMALSYKKSCPFIGKSFSECYCNSMSSLKAEDALYYCGRNYVECPIFKNKSHLTLKDKDRKGVNR